MVIDQTTKMILVRFTIQNSKNIPGSITTVERETADELHERKEGYARGRETIERTKDCSVTSILDGLAQLGFELVGAFHKPMIQYHGGKGHTFHQVRLTFVRCEDVKPDMHEGFKQSRPQILQDVLRLCEEAFWRIRVFDNPFFQNGEMDPIGRSACINLEERKARFLANGNPVVERPKDETGKIISATPEPIRAKHRLVIMDNRIQLVPV